MAIPEAENCQLKRALRKKAHVQEKGSILVRANLRKVCPETRRIDWRVERMSSLSMRKERKEG